jgi:hypothetical protein
VGCNCGGNFQIQEGLEEASPPVPGDPSYFWTGQNPSQNANDTGALVAPNGTPVWNPDTGLTERQA